MIKAVVALLLLALSQQFLTFQLTLWSGSTAREAVNGACIYTHPLPQNAPDPYDHLLAFSGFNFRVFSNISFDAQVVSASSTSLEISAELFSTLRAYQIRFFVVLIDSTSQWAQIEHQSVDLTNASYTGISTYFSFNLSKPLVNMPTSNYEVIPMLQCFTTWTSDRLSIALLVNARAQTYLQMKVFRSFSQSTISLVRYYVIILDKVAMPSSNVQYTINTINLYSNVAVFDPTIDGPPNYSHLSPFANNGGYQGSCFCGTSALQFFSQQTVLFTMDLKADPIVFNRHAQRNDSGAILVYVYQMIVCAQQPFSGAECQAFGFARCIVCTSFSCLTCNNETFLDGNSTCSCVVGEPLGEYCNTIPGCVNLTLVLGAKTCQQCDGIHFHPSPVNGACRRFQGAECWAFGFAGCISCSSLECLNCSTEMQMHGGTCSCYEGEPLGELCNTVPGCINLINVQGGTACVECDGIHFIAEPVDGICRCINNGTIVNGVCNNITGCIFPEPTTTGEIRCRACDSSANFNVTPSSEGFCECLPHYQAEGQGCAEVCGDGVIFSSNSSLCDDGNLADQDGCSSSCTVEDFYRCSSTDPLLPSSCVYQGIYIDLTLSYAERNGEENSGTFAFALHPPLFFLSKMNWSQSANFSCASEYSVSGMSYSEGELVVQVDFTKDLENAECSLNISYDQQLASVKNSSLNFTAVSRNEELVIKSEEDISKRKTIKFIYQILSYCFLGVFLLSLCHKLIGAELAVPFQMVYLSFALYARPSYLSVALRSFTLVTGCRTLFFSQDYQNMLLPFSSRAEMSLQVLESHIVWCGVLLALLLIMGILKSYDYFTSARGREEPHCRNSARLSILYDHLLFPLSVFSSLFTLLSSFVNSLRSQSLEGTFPTTLNSLCWLLLLLSLGLVLSQIFKAESQAQRSDKRSRQFKKRYLPLFLVRLLLLATLFSLGITQTFSFLVFPITLLVLLYLILIVVYRPYRSCFSNLSVILNECLALLAVSLALANKFFTIDSDIEAFILFNMQGLIILCLVLSLIRVFFHVRGLCRKEGEGEGKEGAQPEPKKAIKPTDVDLSLDRECAEQKRRINPYRAILPQHSSPKHTRGRLSEGGEELEQEYELDPHLREIKDRLLASLRKRRGVE